METPVVMPPMGDAAGDLVLSRWFKQPGESVTKGEPLFEVATDKVEVAVEALESGVISQVLIAEGDAADEGQTIAYIEAGPNE